MIRTGALLLTLATPAFAQDVVPADLIIDTFATRCQAIAANPEQAIADGAKAGDDKQGITTTDDVVFYYSESPKLSEAVRSSLIFSGYNLPGENRFQCVMTVNLGSAPAGSNLPDISILLDERAAELIGGPATRYGSDVEFHDQPTRMLIWTSTDPDVRAELSIIASGATIGIALRNFSSPIS
jgi:hypothetical protein